ncbi:GntP family permease [Streptomyces corynorhini]|uniref:GntP family permease n=1 Tax=Streptomyces corynorhini TaxID=2282652 RepID=A0A370BC78_9ACTN|nr:GntP family permease [Streptomyces corynorhini]RDG37403.1 GntP family permease [Streptomyces corynorhini]
MSDAYTLLAFGGAIVALVLLIAKFKVHPVATLFVIVTTLGLVLGLGGEKTLKLVTEGFGSTMSSVGLLIIFGCVLGKMLELSGAALRITEEALRWFSGRKIPWAIALASAVVGIPLIADTVVLMLIPVVSAIAMRSGMSMMRLGPILYIGAYVMTSLVPPGPGPLAASALLGVDLGQAMLYGALVGIPGIIVATLYLLTIKTYVAPKAEYVDHLPTPVPVGAAGAAGATDGTSGTDGSGADDAPGTAGSAPAGGTTGAGEADGTDAEAARLPSLPLSLIPIFTPILLIMLDSYAVDLVGEKSSLGGVLHFLGAPLMALFIGCLTALPLFGRDWRRKSTLNDLFEAGLKLAALPLALTGVGGALALIIRDTKVADGAADMIRDMGLSPIIVPFLVAAAICTITGSNILGVMTAAAIMEPLMEGLGISALAVYLACGTGAQIMKHANSSGFWVTTTLSNMTVGQGIRSIGVASALSGVTGFAILYVLYATGLV